MSGSTASQSTIFLHPPTHGRRASTKAFTLTFADALPHPIRIEYVHDAPHFGAGLTFLWNPPVALLREQAIAAAKKSDIILAFLGLSPELEGEEMPVHVAGFDGGDRTAIELPEAQMQLVNALSATGKPLIIVLMSGSAIALGDAALKASAVLEAWYPGQVGGTAIADTLFGDNNPSGRLSVTFYASTSQLPPFKDYSMKERTYRYFTGQPLYSFGYGLSYTQFKYSNGKLSTTTLKAGDPIKVSVAVQNSGDRDGDETAEVYLIPKNKIEGPLKALVGFQKCISPAAQPAPFSFQSNRASSASSHPQAVEPWFQASMKSTLGAARRLPIPESSFRFAFRVRARSLLDL